MREPVEIRLGEKTWTIRPLTVRQVKALQALVLADGWGSLESCIEAVKIGLDRDHKPDVQQFDDVEATRDELADAMAAVLKQGGFIQKENAAPGEAMAAAGQTGASSKGA